MLAVIPAYENRDMIVGRSADPTNIKQIGNIAIKVPGVTDVKDIKTMFIGAREV